MNENDRPGVRSHRFLDPARVQIQGIRLNIAEHRNSTQ
jgi:hypothetical protein